MSTRLFRALSEMHRFDDLEDLLDFACATVVSLGGWDTAFISFYLGDEAAYGASGCDDGVKDRFHRNFLRTDPQVLQARRQQILEHAWRDSLICFLPEGTGPRLSKAFVTSAGAAGSWRSADRLMIFARDWRGEITGVLSLDNPRDGNRPDEASLEELRDVERFVGLILRIAENRFWSMRLDRSRLRFERAARCSMNWIWEVDAEHRLLYASPAVEDILGLAPGDLQGRPITDLVCERDRLALEVWLGRSERAGNLVARFLHRDGHEVTIDSHGTATPATPDEPAVFLGSSRDISTQILVEQALRASEASYRGIFESATDGLLIFDLDGIVAEANPAACRMLGYPYELLVGRPGSTLFHPDYQVYLEEMRREVRSGGQYDSEAVNVRHDGTSFDVEIHGTGFDFGGQPHLLGVVRDITERKAVADRLLRQQKDESISTLAGGVAHDFNNWLVGILGSADLLRREIQGSEKAEGLCDKILESADQLTGLTQQLLGYARGGKYYPEALSLARVLGETLTLTRGMRPSSVRVEVRAASDLWPVEADRSQLLQVLTNLVLNAYDAMPSGGVVRIDTANEVRTREWTCPRTGLREAGDYVWLRVSDTGAGMDEETKERLFEPFFTTKFQGRGLGLASVLGILKNHGGAIDLESEPGCGASFHVRLPRSERVVEESPEVGSGRESEEKAGERLILVVDDEPVVRQIACAMLETSGWTVLQAADGPEAIAIYRERLGAIEVVLLDVQMPGMGGVEVFEELRRIDPGVRVLLTSGYDEAIAREGLGENGGILGFLPKPYTLEELRGQVRGVVERSREPA